MPIPPSSSLEGLALASTALHPDDLPAVVAEEAAKMGVLDVTIYLAEMSQLLLVPYAAVGESLAIDGTIAGRVYRTERPIVGEDGIVWLPLLDSAERIGVVAMRVEGEVAVDDDLVRSLGAFVNVVGELVVNKAAYGDVITRTRRIEEMTISAEMRWALLPPLTFKGRNFAISAIVEPAYGVAGDTFDYAVNADVVHIAIIDAIGHGLEAARIANLALGSYRHSRRTDADLVSSYWAMDDVLAEQFGIEKFATAQLATLTPSTGRLCWLNAGHPPAIVFRRGHQVDLVSEPCLPVGLAGLAGAAPVVAETTLEPDDTVLFFTDGVVEARSADGSTFGRRRLIDFMERALASGQTPAETMRMLGHAVLAHQRGVLQDDATLLLLSWGGPPS